MDSVELLSQAHIKFIRFTKKQLWFNKENSLLSNRISQLGMLKYVHININTQRCKFGDIFHLWEIQIDEE